MIDHIRLVWCYLITLFFLLLAWFAGPGMLENPLIEWGAFGVAIAIAAVVSTVLVNESFSDLLANATPYIIEYGKADLQTRQSIGHKVPILRVRMTAVGIVQTVDYSDCPLDWFRKFLLDSDKDFISPANHWSDGTPRKMWQLFRNYLSNENAIYQDRAKVNETWRWMPDKFNYYYLSYVTMATPTLKEIPEPPDGTARLPEVEEAKQ